MSIHTISTTAASTTSYYVIKAVGIGAACRDKPDFDHFYISTEPAFSASTEKTVLDGWVDNVGDVKRTAYGRFGTLDEARSIILEDLGDEYREEASDADGVVAVFRIGKYEKLGAAKSISACDTTIAQITARTLDAEIVSMVAEAVRNSREWAQAELHDDAVRAAMTKRRDDLYADLPNNFKVVEYLIGVGPNPDRRFSAIMSYHHDEEDAVNEAERLWYASVIEERDNPESVNPGYSYTYDVVDL